MSGRSQQHQHAKLKPPPRGNFSCGIFRNCIHSALSPTAASAPPVAGAAVGNATAAISPPTDPVSFPSSPPPPSIVPAGPLLVSSSAANPDGGGLAPSSSSSSSSSSASQSFTQWRLPFHHHHQKSPPPVPPSPPPQPLSDPVTTSDALRAAEEHFAAGSHLPALRLLERTLSPDPSLPATLCPPAVMAGVVASLGDTSAARPAAKVLLALVLAEENRRVAVDAGAPAAAVEAVASAAATGPGGWTMAERALAALELLCTVPEGATAVRAHELSPNALARAVETMAGRGRECAIGVLAAIYTSGSGDPPPEVARAVVSAMQGECSARGRRKGAQLLKVLQDSGRLGLAWDGIGG